jgi:predicted O-linked N-acetylglucosamine transferase (SPINDLY family)
MKELITHNIIDYENLIIKLASDKNELNKIKNKMKEKIEQSSFFNSLKFTKELEKIYINLINK